MREQPPPRGKGRRRRAGPESDTGTGPLTERQFHFLPEQRLLYVSVPKVASSTLKVTLLRLALGDPDYLPKRKHRDADRLLHRPPPGFDFDAPDLRRFCFVRDPYARLLSCYLDKFAPRAGWDSPQRLRVRRDLLADPMTPIAFPEFVERVAAQAPADMNRHWRPQTALLHWGKIRYDFVGRLERFEAELARLAPIVDLRPWLHRRTKKTGAATRLADHYTPALAARVRETFAADFEALGYAGELSEG